MRLLFASLLCSAFALVSCHTKNASGIHIDSKFKSFIPHESKALAGVSFDKLKQTDFYKRHQSQLALPALDQFTQQTGVDPRRDLSAFLAAWNGTEAIGMLHGTFQSSTLEKRLDSSTRPEKFNHFELYDDGQRGVVFLPKSIALFGPVPLLKTVLTKPTDRDNAISEDLQLQLARLDSNAQAWIVSSGVITIDQLPVRSDTGVMLSNIVSYIDATSAGVTFSSGANLDAHISCISEEGSQRVHDALKGVIGLARLSTPDNNLDQLKLWDSIHVDREAKKVHVYADLTSEMADRLLSLLSSSTKRL